MYSKEELIYYLSKSKDLYFVHKGIFGNDKNLFTPGLLTEAIVKTIYGLKDYEGDDYDAQKDGKFYEIKGTSSEKGTTTINMKKRPHYLYWIRIDYSSGEILIKYCEFGNINTKEELFSVEALERLKVDPFKKAIDKDRVSITLANVDWLVTEKYRMDNLDY